MESQVKQGFQRPISSNLDTTETFLHFSQGNKAQNPTRSSFIKSLYRVMNLQFADSLEAQLFDVDLSVYRDMNRRQRDYLRAKLIDLKLEDYEYYKTAENENDRKYFKSKLKASVHYYQIKTIMDLRTCSMIAMVEDRIKIVKTSDSCKNKYCYICNRDKSARLSQRFMKLIDTKFSDLDKYRFYFLTLTLRHDRDLEIRDGNYLQELKDYQNKLFRSKMFKSNFQNPVGHDRIGIIQSFENVISDKGYHIHSHILIMSHKLMKSVKFVQEDIKAWWRKKTMVVKDGVDYDTHQLQLKLIGKGISKDNKNDLLGSIRETFKYTTKVSDTNKMTNRQGRLLVDWMNDSKGKNMLNAIGLFRGFKLTSAKSDLDDSKDIFVPRENGLYELDRTGSIKYKSGKEDLNLYKRFSKNDRLKYFEKVKINQLSGSNVDVSEVVNMIDTISVYDYDDIGITQKLLDKVKDMKRLNDEILKYEREYNEGSKKCHLGYVNESGWWTNLNRFKGKQKVEF